MHVYLLQYHIVRLWLGKTYSSIIWEQYKMLLSCTRCLYGLPTRFPFSFSVVLVLSSRHFFFGLCRCTFMNFASNTKCLRCQEQRPKRQLNPGEWECPSWVTFVDFACLCFVDSTHHTSGFLYRCDFLNFRSNMACKKCTCERPKDAKTQSKYEQQLWTKPY